MFKSSHRWSACRDTAIGHTRPHFKDPVAYRRKRLYGQLLDLCEAPFLFIYFYFNRERSVVGAHTCVLLVLTRMVENDRVGAPVQNVHTI